MNLNPTKNSNRATALDALRGFAILTMVLSGVIPYKVLPAWMYHAQIPPPTHQFNPDLPGLTWVDLVFPMFLFALGAANPLALSRRIGKGESISKILFSIGERGFLLGFFAIFLRHVRPHVIESTPSTQTWLIALLGFVLMFPIFLRLPAAWKSRWKYSVKIGGWLAVIILLLNLQYPDGSGFLLSRSDIILVVLTNVAVFGSLIWLLTRNNPLVRLSLLGILIALRLSHTEIGWIQWLWNFSPAPWIYKMYYLQYLFIVIPGTIIGERLLSWMQTPETSTINRQSWSPLRFLSLAGISVSFIILLLIGMQARWVWQTALAAAFLCGTGYLTVMHANNEVEKLLKTLFLWATYWLILGLFFEPFESGIKKDHTTLSYYFVTTGLSIYLLIAFFIIGDVFKKQRWMQLLIDNGKNPMIAYTGFANFIWPILALTGLEKMFLSITPTPWLGFLRGLFYTIILALLVQLFSKRKIFWRT
jgi:predicted acyltransferase